MIVHKGYFANPEEHHTGWFRVFHGPGLIEVWFGHRWIFVSLY